MNEPVRFLCVTFRSRGHCVWSQITTACFLLALVVAIGLIFVHTQTPVPEPLGWFMTYLGCAAFAYFSLAMIALIQTRGGRRENRIYSSDCIWFNVVISALYQMLRYLVKMIV